MNARYFVVCDNHAIDPNTGQASAFGLIDFLWAEEYPHRFQIGMLLGLDFALVEQGSKRAINVAVITPDGGTLFDAHVEMTVSELPVNDNVSVMRPQMICPMACSLVAPVPGDYTFIVTDATEGVEHRTLVELVMPVVRRKLAKPKVRLFVPGRDE